MTGGALTNVLIRRIAFTGLDAGGSVAPVRGEGVEVMSVSLRSMCFACRVPGSATASERHLRGRRAARGYLQSDWTTGQGLGAAGESARFAG